MIDLIAGLIRRLLRAQSMATRKARWQAIRRAERALVRILVVTRSLFDLPQPQPLPLVPSARIE